MNRSDTARSGGAGSFRLWSLSLLGLTALAAALRIPNLGKPSFWWDECLTARLLQDVSDASPLVVLNALSRGLSPYFVLLAPLVGVGTPEWTLRVPSALAGVALVVVLALLGREIGGRPLGLRLGLLAAISPWMVWHSREARWYALTVLLVAIGLLFFVKLLRAWHWGLAAGCFAAGLAAASTYSPAITILVLQFAWLGLASQVRAGLTQRWLRAGGGRRTILALIAGLLFLMAAVWSARTLLLPAIAGGAGGFGFHNLGGPRLGAVAYTGIAHATGYTLGPGPSEWHLLDRIGLRSREVVLLVVGTLSFLALTLIGARRIATTRGRPFCAALLMLAGVPTILVIAASWWTDHAYAPRHVAFTYPVSLALAAAGLQREGMRRAAVLSGAIVISLQAVALWNLYFEPRYLREDIGAAARHIAARAAPGDLVLLFGAVKVPWEYYYDGRAPWTMVYAGGGGAWSEERLRDRLASQAQVWVVRGRMWEEPGAESLASIVDSWSPAVETSRFAGNVLVSRHRPGGAGTDGRDAPLPGNPVRHRPAGRTPRARSRRSQRGRPGISPSLPVEPVALSARGARAIA